MYALQITTTDGTDVDLEAIDLPGEQDRCHDQLRELVGGPLECVSLSSGAVAVIHEEGAYTLPRNPAATLFVHTAVVEDGRALIGGIHGTAVILGMGEAGWAPITIREMNRMLALASLMARG